MSLLLDETRGLRRNPRVQVLNSRHAAILTQVPLEKLRSLATETEGPVSALQLAQAMKELAAKEVAARETATQQEIEAQGVVLADDMDTADDVAQAAQEKREAEKKMREAQNKHKVIVALYERDGRRVKRFRFTKDTLYDVFDGKDPYDVEKDMEKLSLKHNSTNIVTAICQHVELAVELGKHLEPEDIIRLYSINRMFHNAVNEHMMSTVKTWIVASAPEAGRIFHFKMYRRLLVRDPAGRTEAEINPPVRPMNQIPHIIADMRADEARKVPGMQWMQLVLTRNRRCHEIVAILARNGHRCPLTMHATLLRLWMLMDIGTTAHRQAYLRNVNIWTDVHLYNAQFLFMKLGMHFNDPIYGPSSWDLLILILGQHGLYPLWQLLMRKKYNSLPEILELAVRYNYELPADHWGQDLFHANIHGVPFDYVGLTHFEGWGVGDLHLMRPDELIPIEAVVRGLELDKHLRYMMVWGYFDFATGENLVPTEEEMYISPHYGTLAHMDTSHHWRRKHVLKKRWNTLTPAQQQDIIEEDEDERLRALAWCGEDSDYDDYSSDDEETPYTLDDEINRGYMVRPQAKDHKSDVPALDDQAGWSNFVNGALIGLPPQLNPDEMLQAEAWHQYRTKETDCAWDWSHWLEEQRGRDASRNPGEASGAGGGGEQHEQHVEIGDDAEDADEDDDVEDMDEDEDSEDDELDDDQGNEGSGGDLGENEVGADGQNGEDDLSWALAYDDTEMLD